MEGLVRLSYWLGWVCFALAVLGRVLLQTSLADRMIAWGVMPHNFLQLTFLFFLVSIATALYNRQNL